MDFFLALHGLKHVTSWVQLLPQRKAIYVRNSLDISLPLGVHPGTYLLARYQRRVGMSVRLFALKSLKTGVSISMKFGNPDISKLKSLNHRASDRHPQFV